MSQPALSFLVIGLTVMAASVGLDLAVRHDFVPAAVLGVGGLGAALAALGDIRRAGGWRT